MVVSRPSATCEPELGDFVGYQEVDIEIDIVPQNIVYGLNVDIGKMPLTDKSKLLGRPRKARIFEDDELVGELVTPAEFPLDILGSDAYLCDFGILVKAGTSVPNKL